MAFGVLSFCFYWWKFKSWGASLRQYMYSTIAPLLGCTFSDIWLDSCKLFQKPLSFQFFAMIVGFVQYIYWFAACIFSTAFKMSLIYGIFNGIVVNTSWDTPSKLYLFAVKTKSQMIKHKKAGWNSYFL